jgi:hypothetical protein
LPEEVNKLHTRPNATNEPLDTGLSEIECELFVIDENIFDDKATLFASIYNIFYSILLIL